MRTVNRITGIEPPSAGATTSVNIPVGPRYHALKFFITLDGVAASVTDALDRVRLKVNQKYIRDLPVARILALAALNGITPAVGELPIYFSEPGRADKEDEQWSAWDTFGESDFTVEFTWKNPLPVGTNRIEGLRYFDNGATLVTQQTTNGPVQVRQKNIVRQFEYTKQVPSGLSDLDDLTSFRAPILRILFTATSALNRVEITADSNLVFEASVAQNARTLADYGLDASAFTFPVCFDFTEKFTDFLLAAKTINMRVGSAAAQGVGFLVETITAGFGSN